MKYILLSILVFFTVKNGITCSCDFYEADFYKNVYKNGFNCIAVFNTFETATIENIGEQNIQIGYFIVTDIIKSGKSQIGDTIKVLGSSGANCGEQLSVFEKGDTLALALSPYYTYEFQNDTFYLEGTCGKHFLEIKNGKNDGLTISEITEKIKDSISTGTENFRSIVEDDYTFNKSHVTDKALFQDSIILVSGFVSAASCPHYSLFAYNFKGQKLWDTGGFFDLIYAGSDYIYTAGYTPIDDISGIEQIVIAKYDKEGNEIFSIGYPEIPHDEHFEFEPQSIDIASDGTILVSSNKSVIKSDVNGTKIQEYQLTNMPDISGIISLNPETWFIHSQNRIYKSDSSFVLSDSLRFSGSINKLLLKNDTVFTLLDSALVRLDTSLNVIDTLIETSTGFQDMEFYDKNLWIRMNDSDSIKLIRVKNNNITDTLTFDLLSDVKGFIIADNNYTFIGNSFTGQIGLYNYQAPLTSITSNLRDIELVDFEIDSIILEYVTTPDMTFARGFHFNSELTIKNNGMDTIHTFSVFSDLYGGMNCFQNYFYQKLSGLEIFPGQTQKVKLKRAYQEGMNHNQLCFECLAPNSKLEKLTDNNTLCKTFTITGIENRIQPSVKIYPNPFSDYLIIEHTGSNMKNIELTDISGRTLIHETTTNQRITIKTNGLKPGPYILKVDSDGKTNTQLILKE